MLDTRLRLTIDWAPARSPLQILISALYIIWYPVRRSCTPHVNWIDESSGKGFRSFTELPNEKKAAMSGSVP